MPKVNGKKYQQKYTKSWEEDPALKDWLVPDPSNDVNASCKYCHITLKAHKKSLLDHGKTGKHTKAVELSRTAKSCKKITTVIKPIFSEATKIAELKMAAFIAEHTALLTVDHLMSVVPQLDPESDILKNLKLHRTKCSMLIKNVLGPCMLSNLLEEIGDNPFSLIIDESTDLSTQKVLCIMIRFFSVKKKQVVSTFYRLIKLVNCDAISVYNAIKTQLEEDGLNYQKMVGIGADGASVMVGKYNSVTALFKRELGDLIIVKCVCHSLHLCSEKAAEELPRQLEFLIRETHNWFSYSTKRLEQYRDLYESINEGNRNPNKVQGQSGTRWLARYAAIDTILKQWDELQLLFSLAQTQDKCFMAEQLYDIMRRPAFKAYLVFLRTELKHVTQINLLFQSEYCEPTKLLEDLFLLYKQILQKIVVPSQLQKIHDNELAEFNFQPFLMHSASLNLGYDFEEIAKVLQEKDLLDIKARCKNFLCTLAMEMQKRLPENLAILKIMTILKPEVATSQVKPSLNNIMQGFHRSSVFGNKNDVEAEWNQIQNKQWTNASASAAEFYAEVYNDSDAGNNKRFENVSKFAIALLTLPVSNASVERAFSIYAIIKSKLRNRLSLKMCQNIMMVRFSLQREYKSCVNFTPTSNMIKNFNVRMYEYNQKSSNDEDEQDDNMVLEIINRIV